MLVKEVERGGEKEIVELKRRGKKCWGKDI